MNDPDNPLPPVGGGPQNSNPTGKPPIAKYTNPGKPPVAKYNNQQHPQQQQHPQHHQQQPQDRYSGPSPPPQQQYRQPTGHYPGPQQQYPGQPHSQSFPGPQSPQGPQNPGYPGPQRHPMQLTPQPNYPPPPSSIRSSTSTPDPMMPHHRPPIQLAPLPNYPPPPASIRSSTSTINSHPDPMMPHQRPPIQLAPLPNYPPPPVSIRSSSSTINSNHPQQQLQPQPPQGLPQKHPQPKHTSSVASSAAPSPITINPSPAAPTATFRPINGHGDTSFMTNTSENSNAYDNPGPSISIDGQDTSFQKQAVPIVKSAGPKKGFGEGGRFSAEYSRDSGDEDDAVALKPPRSISCCMIILALMHISVGVACITLQIFSMESRTHARHRLASGSYIAFGVWTGVCFIVVGVTGIIAQTSFSLKALKVYLYMNVVALVFVVALFMGTMAAMILDDIHLENNPDRKKWNLYNGLMIGFGLLEVIVIIVCISLSCRSGAKLCGRSCCLKKDDDDDD